LPSRTVTDSDSLAVVAAPPQSDRAQPYCQCGRKQ
jgi:hypothetical protein